MAALTGCGSSGERAGSRASQYRLQMPVTAYRDRGIRTPKGHGLMPAVSTEERSAGRYEDEGPRERSPYRQSSTKFVVNTSCVGWTRLSTAGGRSGGLPAVLDGRAAQVVNVLPHRRRGWCGSSHSRAACRRWRSQCRNRLAWTGPGGGDATSAECELADRHG